VLAGNSLFKVDLLQFFLRKLFQFSLFRFKSSSLFVCSFLLSKRSLFVILIPLDLLLILLLYGIVKTDGSFGLSKSYFFSDEFYFFTIGILSPFNCGNYVTSSSSLFILVVPLVISSKWRCGTIELILTTISPSLSL